MSIAKDELQTLDGLKNDVGLVALRFRLGTGDLVTRVSGLIVQLIAIGDAREEQRTLRRGI